MRRYFESHSYPRAVLSLILAVTGLIGFGLSYGLLHLGLVAMWLRYPITVLGAYVCCLGLLRLWIAYEHRRFKAEQIELEEIPPATRETSVLGHGTRSWSWLDALDFGDLDGEGCVVFLFLGVLIGIVAVLVTLISGASTLLAEVFLDAFFVSALYRRLRVAAVEHWLGTAIRRTYRDALLLALFLGLLGMLLSWFAPGTHSIGPALHELIYGKSVDL